MAKYPEALSSFTAAIEIMKKTLQANHPDLAVCHDNVAMVYSGMQKYTEAMMSYREALDVRQKTVPINYRELSMSYSYIGSLYSAMGMQAEALSSITTALEMQQKYLPAIHPYLACTHSMIGVLYSAMGMRKEALSSTSKGLEMSEEALPENYPEERYLHSRLQHVYWEMRRMVFIWSSDKTGPGMQSKYHLEDHLYWSYCVDTIQSLYSKMGILPTQWPSITTALERPQTSFQDDYYNYGYFHSGVRYFHPEMGFTLEALWSVRKALEMLKVTLAPKQSDLGDSAKDLTLAHSKMEKDPNSLEPSETTLDFKEPSNQEDAEHPQTPMSHISGADSVEGTYLPMNLKEDRVVPPLGAQPAEILVPAFIIDSLEHKHLILLQMASMPSSRLYKGICQLSGTSSTTSTSFEAYAGEPTPTTFIIDTEGMLPKQLETLLDYITGHKHLRLVYIRGEQPNGVDERQIFFTRYQVIQGMNDNEDWIVMQWAMDTANEYRQMGDALVKSGDKEKARLCFAKGVALYENLSGFLEKTAAR